MVIIEKVIVRKACHFQYNAVFNAFIAITVRYLFDYLGGTYQDALFTMDAFVVINIGKSSFRFH